MSIAPKKTRKTREAEGQTLKKRRLSLQQESMTMNTGVDERTASWHQDGINLPILLSSLEEYLQTAERDTDTNSRVPCMSLNVSALNFRVANESSVLPPILPSVVNAFLSQMPG